MPGSAEIQDINQSGGSPPSGEPLFLAVGRLLRPHGLNGELAMTLLTDFPERLKSGLIVFIGEQHIPIQIQNTRGHSSGFLITLLGVDTAEKAAELRNSMVFVRAEDLPPLPAGDYYHHQLIGLRVISDTGDDLGKVTSILETGANDVLVIQQPNLAELLLPNTAEVVLAIDLERGEMRVHLLPGLIAD